MSGQKLTQSVERTEKFTTVACLAGSFGGEVPVLPNPRILPGDPTAPRKRPRWLALHQCDVRRCDLDLVALRRSGEGFIGSPAGQVDRSRTHEVAHGLRRVTVPLWVDPEGSPAGIGCLLPALLPLQLPGPIRPRTGVKRIDLECLSDQALPFRAVSSLV